MDGLLGTAASVQASFVYGPRLRPCTMPGVKGHAFSRKVKKGLVISQSPLKDWQPEHWPRRERSAPVARSS